MSFCFQYGFSGAVIPSVEQLTHHDVSGKIFGPLVHVAQSLVWNCTHNPSLASTRVTMFTTGGFCEETP